MNTVRVVKNMRKAEVSGRRLRGRTRYVWMSDVKPVWGEETSLWV